MRNIRSFVLFGLIAVTAALPASSDVAQAIAPKADKFTAALFQFDGKDAAAVADASGKGAVVVLGSSGKTVDGGLFDGALQMAPRQDESDPKTYVRLSDGNVDLSSAFTIDFWVNIHTDKAGLYRSEYFLSSPNLFFRFNVDFVRYGFEFGIQTAKGWTEIGTRKDKLTPEANRWYHLTGTYDGSELRLYVDGQLQASAECANPPVSMRDNFVLGGVGWADEKSTELDGLIDGLSFSTIARGGDSFAQSAAPETSAPAARVPESSLPHILIPKTSQAPVIDGRPAGGAWDKAVWVSNPVYLNQKEITSKLDFQAGTLWDDDALYVGFKVQETHKPVSITATNGDDGLERDDSVEVTLSIPGFAAANGEPVQFKLNCAGLRDDAINFNFGWNAQWDGKVTQDGNNWYATFKLPFSNFGVSPKAGDKWGGNFGAFLVGYDYRAFLWTPVYSGHHHSGPFGTLEFGDANVPASSIRKLEKQMSSVSVSGTIASPGSVRVMILPESGDAKKDGTANGFLNVDFDPEKVKSVAQSSTKIENPGEWTASVNGISPGSYLVKIILMDASGRVLNTDVKPVRIERSLAMSVLRYPVIGSANAVVTVYNMGKPGIVPASLNLTLTDAKGAVVRTLHPAVPIRLGEPMTISLGKLVNKQSYRLVTKAVSPDGKDTVSETANFALPARPVWADTKAGALNGKVLKPWTPVRANGTSLACWGRTYDLGKSIMPVSIVSKGHKILAAPIRIVAASGADSVVLSKAQSPAGVTVSRTGDIARYQASAGSKICDLKVSGSLEFDGFMSFDLAVKPKKALDTFVVEIPLDNKLAKCIQPLPGAKNRDVAGAIPDSGVCIDSLDTLYTKNSVWLCNEDAGLYFQCESLQGWKSPTGKAVEVIRRGQDTLLRLNIYKSDQGFSQARNYRFYLQATPIRPFNKDWWSKDRYDFGILWGDNVSPLEPDTVASMPLDAISSAANGTFEIIVRNLNDLEAITKMPGDPGNCCDEKILNIESSDGKLNLLYSKQQNAMSLMTPWGNLGLKDNALWKPNGLHKLAFTWGNELKFYVDGKEQGSLPVSGLPLQSAKLNIGSVSARYIVTGLRVRSSVSDTDSLASTDKMAKTPDTLAYRADELNIRSNARTRLSQAKEIGHKIVCLWENWTQAQGGGYSVYEPALKNLSEDVHKLGLKFVLYVGFEISELPEFDDIRDECKALVNQSPNYYAPHGQNTYFVSYGGPYTDYLLYNLDRLKKEMHIDGTYCDATWSMWGADNPAFGCGYTDENGKRVATIPIQRIRELAKRMNNLFIQDGGYIVAHLAIAPPTMGFASQTSLGEHLAWTTSNWKKASDVIAPDEAITIFNPKNTGVGKTLILLNMWPTIRKGSPDRWYEHAMAFTDQFRLQIPVMVEDPMFYAGLEEAKKYQKFAGFGADKAEWIPFWELSDKGVCSSSTMIMSVYRRSDKAMICVVSNNSDQQVTGYVDFSASPRLSLKPGAKCTDLMNGEPIKMDGSRVSITIPANERVLLKVE